MAVPNAAEDLRLQDGVAEAIYFVPTGFVGGSYVFDYGAMGPKRYLIAYPVGVCMYWTETFPRGAILLWKMR